MTTCYHCLKPLGPFNVLRAPPVPSNMQDKVPLKFQLQFKTEIIIIIRQTSRSVEYLMIIDDN